ncbi:putative methyltransferase-domain-containing protein [Blastocladiella britannica]|nr:putative methyltransferase-domain-containing protein [Blastocladiella britannica]
MGKQRRKKTPIVASAARATLATKPATTGGPPGPKPRRARVAISSFHAQNKALLHAPASGAAKNASAAPKSATDLLQADSPALAAYQHASLKIQSTKYPSELLVSWLQYAFLTAGARSGADAASPRSGDDSDDDDDLDDGNAEGHKDEFVVPAKTMRACSNQMAKLRLLDVGALEGPAAYARASRMGPRQVLGHVRSIDLHPMAKGVEQGDFFHLPFPAATATTGRAVSHPWSQFAVQPIPRAWATPLSPEAVAQYDVVSLSLVVNFLPTPLARGAMLAKAAAHLDPAGPRLVALCLPRACLDNSRYLTRDHLVHTLLGSERGIQATLVAERWSIKLWCGMIKVDPQWCGKHALDRWTLRYNNDFNSSSSGGVKKTVVNDGKGRNNFAIVFP